MANRDVTPGEVKSICDGLECSPSHKQASSKIYNSGHSLTPPNHSPAHKSGAGGTMTKTGDSFGVPRRTAAKNVPKHV